jgi:peptidoglycan/LPS O-acetylase OafA/YrhL
MMARGVDREVTYQLTICRMDGLLAGAIVAIAWHLPRLRATIESHRAWLIPMALAVLLAGAVPTRGYELSEMSTQVIGYSALAAGFALVIARLAADQGRGAPRLLGILDTGLLRSVGKYSYAMYIVHYPLDRYLFRPMLVQHFGEMAPPQIEVLYGTLLVILSYGLGYLSWTALERRFLQMGTSSVRQPQPPLVPDRVRPAR